MSAKNIKIANATYPTVPAIVLKSDTNVDVTFTDTSIDADATADDIANGKKAWVNGSLIVGTHEESGGGGKNVQGYHGMATVRTTSYSATGVKLTVAKTGTYKVSWMGARNNSSNTFGSQLYINNSAYGSATTTFTNTYGQSVVLTNVSLTTGDEVEVRARARSVTYAMMVGNLIIEEV